LLEYRADADGNLPTEFRIFEAGITDTTKGFIVFDGFSVESVQRLLAKHGRTELPIDYEHGMLANVQLPGTGAAAGWFVPEMRNGELWAASIRWTERAEKMLRASEYRFFSPAVELDENRRVVRLVNIALTNLPATIGQLPLVAHELDTPPRAGEHKEQDMGKLLERLGAKDDAEAIAMVEALSSANDGLLTMLGVKDFGAAETAIVEMRELVKQSEARATELAEQATELAAKVAEIEARGKAVAKDGLIAKLSSEGKLPPSLHDWAKSLDMAALEAFGERAPVVIGGAIETAGKAEEKLSDDELAVLRQFSVAKDEYIKSRAAVLAKKEAE
jgi:phage I-like protein